ncbi:MAG: pantetheine-phosphate adenylyltransferase [Clostridia bacterium]|nr:pantetheine-phosphate adenylyltransferase [Clostridia bacterium]
MKKCVFAGTFDPPTTGHKNVIDTCLEIFDEVVVGVGINTAKTPMFSADERKALLEKLYGGEKRVRVVLFVGAAVDLLESENTRFYVRGLRNTVDFEYETADHFASKKLKKDLVTLYVPAEQESLHISSSLVRNSRKFKKDFLSYVPEKILSDVIRLMEEKNV